MNKLLNTHLEYSALYNDVSKEIELLVRQLKETSKLAFAFEKEELSQLSRMDEKMTNKGYVRKGSRYIHKDNGHRVRFNKLSYINIPRNSLLFIADNKFISSVIDAQNKYKELLDIKNKNTKRKDIIGSKVSSIEIALKEHLKDNIISELYSSKIEYIDYIENYIENLKTAKRPNLLEIYKIDIEKIFKQNNIDIISKKVDSSYTFNFQRTLRENSIVKEYKFDEYLYKIYSLTKNIEIKRAIFKILEAYILKQELTLLLSDGKELK